MTSTDQHLAKSADSSQLLGATHAWRSVLRQAAASLGCMAELPPDRPTRVALNDVVNHLQRACALLTVVDATLDSTVAPVRREQCSADLAARAQRASG
jgi:hypothetical protein